MSQQSQQPLSNLIWPPQRQHISVWKSCGVHGRVHFTRVNSDELNRRIFRSKYSV
jgi:hypothetical protein